MNGILLIDKPESWTSNDVVQKLRGILHEKRIGHAGTLDPMATGLLTVFVGRATRAVEFAEEALQAFRGEIRQTPPMYSAVKVNGRRLYELARKGETVERKEREITVYSLEVLEQNGEDWLLDVSCSKGTYVRTLCHDIGEALGCGGCLSSLRRTEAGLFSVENAHTVDAVAVSAAAGLADALLLDEARVRNGSFFRLDSPDGFYRLYGGSGEFLALARVAGGTCRTIKSFFEV